MRLASAFCTYILRNTIWTSNELVGVLCNLGHLPPLDHILSGSQSLENEENYYFEDADNYSEDVDYVPSFVDETEEEYVYVNTYNLLILISLQAQFHTIVLQIQ